MYIWILNKRKYIYIYKIIRIDITLKLIIILFYNIEQIFYITCIIYNKKLRYVIVHLNFKLL